MEAVVFFFVLRNRATAGIRGSGQVILIDSVTDLVPATVQLGGPAGGKEMGKEINKREANQLGRG